MAAVAPAADAAAQAAQPAPGGIMQQISGVFRMIIFMQVVRYMVTPSQPTAPAAVIPGGSPRATTMRPLWSAGQRFDLYVYTSEEPHFDDFDDKNALIWRQKDIVFDWDANRAENLTLPCPETLQNNGTLYAHVYAVTAGKALNQHTDPLAVVYKSGKLNVHRPKPKVHAKKNLISGEFGDDRLKQADNLTAADVAAKTAAPQEIVSFWRPVLNLRLLLDASVFPASGPPPPLNEHFVMVPHTDMYYPVLWFDYFWLMTDKLILLNDTVKELPLEVSYSPISLLKWQFMLQMDQSWKTQQEWGTGSEDDTQEFKRMILETNPYFLGLTFFISTLHMVFDFLAFKNDIAFWKDNKSMTGLSIRSIFLNAACQFIIFLYLMDNETSWMILISSGLGLVIEVWKIFKALNIKYDATKPYRFSWHHQANYEESGTAQYDREAMIYLSYALYPLVIGYACYSVMYENHKSWYSWILGSLVGTVYTFGFIMMCPQLYLNYKLKSVAHMPWRMMTYKFLNTIIDDLFAFIIKMPTLHRLSVFRDDIIFLIFLYQRWIYRVDMTRINEFGYQPPVEGDEKKDVAAAPAAIGVAPTATAAEQPAADQVSGSAAAAGNDASKPAPTVTKRSKAAAAAAARLPANENKSSTQETQAAAVPAVLVTEAGASPAEAIADTSAGGARQRRSKKDA